MSAGLPYYTTTTDPWWVTQTATIIPHPITVTISIGGWDSNDLTREIRDFVDNARTLLKLKRERSLAARLAATRTGRRYPIRVVTRPRQTERFAGRTCSQSSRWMVSQ